MTELDELRAQIQKLERDNRMTKWGVALLGLVTATATVLFWWTLNRGHLDVKEITVRDGSGAEIAHLGGDKYGTCLKLSVRSAASNATLCVDPYYGANLDLSNRNPKTKVLLSAGTKLYESVGGRLMPGLHIEGEDGQNAFHVNVGSDAKLFLGRSETENSVTLLGGNQVSLQVVGQNKELLKVPH